VDDALVIHHEAEKELRKIDYFFAMKPDSIGDPNVYLGAKLREVRLPNGVSCWSMSASKYVQTSVENVERYLLEHYDGRKLLKKVSEPLQRDYRPEMDTSPELDAGSANYFQSLIGILRWMVELGRIDMIAEVSMLSSHLACPREGHLEAVFHIFSWLKVQHNRRLAFDPTYPDVDLEDFEFQDWTEQYGDIKEAIPPNAPEPRGKVVDIRLFVDSDHAGDGRDRRSRSCYFIFVNKTIVNWFSKKQATVETSVFGAEFVAMKLAMESNRALRYKLRMMGVPIDGQSYAYGDNMSVIHNTQRPESTLKKKSHQICFHAIRESVAMGEMLTAHIPMALNPADIGTKLIPPGYKRDSLVDLLLWDTGTGDHLHEVEK